VIQGFRIEEALMRKRVYWLNDADWKRIEPLLPKGQRGARRVDDRRVISGIMHMLHSGSRWRDCPPDYGPYTTIYNRFNRWSRRGIWTGIFYALTGSTGMIGTVAVDSTHIKAHRSAAGAKGGPSATPLAVRAAVARPKSTR
jgi:transposase